MSKCNSVERMNATDLFDEISQRIVKARAIVDCLGNLDLDGGSLRDDSRDGAAWAAKDLLSEAGGYAEALLAIARRSHGGEARGIE